MEKFFSLAVFFLQRLNIFIDSTTVVGFNIRSGGDIHARYNR